MGRSRETFGKKEVRKKQIKKRKEKESRRQERKEHGSSGKLEDMLAWVDENGNIISEPPTKTKKSEVKAENIEVSIPKAEPGEHNKYRTGKVINFNESKSFGFISSPSLSESVFFHTNDCLEHISDGDQVVFETEKGLKGLKAFQIKKMGAHNKA